jgi:hypothetical protein
LKVNSNGIKTLEAEYFFWKSLQRTWNSFENAGSQIFLLESFAVHLELRFIPLESK